ncbi:MAG: MBOAT family protein [Planctomycetaceae bacterium]|jgi:alginate O-acetyltransferase complex protein AlgI|nr:MBOAT family protein [Planctomycetaceae bacterium]
MLFTQLEFPIFLVAVLICVWLSRTHTARNSLLLVASYYFYAYWDYRFCGLLLLSTVVDFVVAKQMFRAQTTSTRRSLLLISLAVNLGVLGFFKYFNFFIDSARPLLESIGMSGQTLQIILPVGISFYTFQTLSYTIDVYRGVLKPVNRFLDFALYVAFFPQLVAGPIVRARELLPQLATVPEWSGRRFYGGAQQILRGTVKKMLLADRLGEAVDIVFASPDFYDGPTLWLAAFAYAGQIYYDFSGYSDIAIGAAKMLGYRFPINFRHPYLARSTAEFWHRWHMTLSRWLRDYLYISLGGNRVSSIVTYRNLMITMTLGGLWHGAAWTFVLWGAWHGMALSVQRWFSNHTRRRPPAAVGWALTMGVVLLGWVLFRSPDLAIAKTMLIRMATLADGIAWHPPLALLALACLLVEHVAWRTRLRKAMRLPINAWYSPIATTVMVWSLLLYAPRGFRPFVYFQF